MHTVDHSQQTSFGRKAQCYDTHALSQRESADWLAQWLPQELMDQRCLELGSGTGLLTRHLSTSFRTVEASDLEVEMLRTCQQSLPEVEYQVRDAWAPQPDNGQWDCVASASLLQWAENPVEILSHWRQLLKPEGRLLLGYFVQPSLPELYTILKGDGPINWRTPDEWASIFATAGLTCLQMETQTKRYYYPNAMAFWRGLHGTGAVVPRRTSPKALLRMLRQYQSDYMEDDQVYATWSFSRVELV